MKVLGQAALVLLVLYFTSYVVLRSRWTHRRESDGLLYMKFPSSPTWLHSFYQPLFWIDEKMTNMHFQFGPNLNPHVSLLQSSFSARMALRH
jgi:hypothetical protein